MLNILLIYSKPIMSELVKSYFIRNGTVNILEAETVNASLQIVTETKPDLVIVDDQLDTMSGVEFINILVQVNPFINTALVSGLLPEHFHEETEGLGVLMQFPVEPQKKDAEELLQKMEKIVNLMVSPQGKEVFA